MEKEKVGLKVGENKHFHLRDEVSALVEVPIVLSRTPHNGAVEDVVGTPRTAFAVAWRWRKVGGWVGGKPFLSFPLLYIRTVEVAGGGSVVGVAGVVGPKAHLVGLGHCGGEVGGWVGG